MAHEFRQPRHPAIDEAMIRALVHGFYDKVRRDPALGPIFERVVQGEWDGHLARMCDFWSSVMLATRRYKGTPMAAHMRLKTVRPEHFQRWLELFGQTARDVAPPDAAALFIDRAETIARSLQMGMFFQPGAPRPA